MILFTIPFTVGRFPPRSPNTGVAEDKQHRHISRPAEELASPHLIQDTQQRSQLSWRVSSVSSCLKHFADRPSSLSKI